MIVRLARASDSGAVAAIYRPIVRGTAISFEIDDVTDQQMAGRIDAAVPSLPWLVAEDAGAVVGYAYAGPHRARAAYAWSVEVSAYVAATARRRGVGRRLYTTLLALLSAQGYGTALAGITLPNPASVALHESLDFVHVGVFRAVGWKDGAWRDVGWWQRRLVETSAPRPPTPLTDIPDLVTRLRAS